MAAEDYTKGLILPSLSKALQATSAETCLQSVEFMGV